MTHIQKAVYSLRIFVVQSLSCVQLLAIPRTVASQVPLSSPISQSWLKFMSPESVMLSNHLILCRPFSLRHQFSPAGGSFPVSWIFASGDQSIRASATVLPVTTQGWFPLRLTGLISLQSKVFSRIFTSITVPKHQFFSSQPSLWSNSHIHTITGKPALTIWTFVSKVMSLLFNMLSTFVLAFLSWSKRLLISWLQPPSAVILEPKKRKSVTASTFSPSVCHEVMERDAMILDFLMLNFRPGFSLFSFTFIKRLFGSSSLSAIWVVSSVYLRWLILIFFPAVLIPACDSSSLAFRLMYSA